jgi:hypothetical protein
MARDDFKSVVQMRQVVTQDIFEEHKRMLPFLRRKRNEAWHNQGWNMDDGKVSAR